LPVAGFANADWLPVVLGKFLFVLCLCRLSLMNTNSAMEGTGDAPTDVTTGGGGKSNGWQWVRGSAAVLHKQLVLINCQ